MKLDGNFKAAIYPINIFNPCRLHGLNILAPTDTIAFSGKSEWHLKS
jgi:hypothetical protein